MYEKEKKNYRIQAFIITDKNILVIYHIFCDLVYMYVYVVPNLRTGSNVSWDIIYPPCHDLCPGRTGG